MSTSDLTLFAPIIVMLILASIWMAVMWLIDRRSRGKDEPLLPFHKSK